MKKLFIILAIFFFNLMSYAEVYKNPSKISDFINILPELKSEKCKFKQEKIIPNVNKPLISSGDFEFIESKGVYFYTKYPYEIKTDYTNKNYKKINDITKAISDKKYSTIEKEFNFYFEGNKSNWVLKMTPKKTSKTEKYLSYITVFGSKSINKIEIKQINGYKTSIWLQR